MISVSYGQIEGALPQFYQERQCREWMKLALQGDSVICASGDFSNANRYSSGYNNSCLDCKYGYVDTDGTRFLPSFPDNCPYASPPTNTAFATLSCLRVCTDPQQITSVGTTTLLNSSVYGGERAVASPDGPLSYYSGGGYNPASVMAAQSRFQVF